MAHLPFFWRAGTLIPTHFPYPGRDAAAVVKDAIWSGILLLDHVSHELQLAEPGERPQPVMSVDQPDLAMLGGEDRRR